MPRLFLVDDDYPIRTLCRRGLERRGFQGVGERGTGESLIADVQSTDPDLVLMDIEASFGNGFDSIETLRSLGFVVVATSARPGTSWLCQALSRGASAVETKMAGLVGLERALHCAMDRSVRRREFA